MATIHTMIWQNFLHYRFAIIGLVALSGCTSAEMMLIPRPIEIRSVKHDEWAKCFQQRQLLETRIAESSIAWLRVTPLFFIRPDSDWFMTETPNSILVTYIVNGQAPFKFEFRRLNTKQSESILYIGVDGPLARVKKDHPYIVSIAQCAAELEAAQKSERVAGTEKTERP